jgi:hypothetical protein
MSACFIGSVIWGLEWGLSCEIQPDWLGENRSGTK